jgi:hypothetical protein
MLRVIDGCLQAICLFVCLLSRFAVATRKESFTSDDDSDSQYAAAETSTVDQDAPSKMWALIQPYFSRPSAASWNMLQPHVVPIAGPPPAGTPPNSSATILHQPALADLPLAPSPTVRPAGSPSTLPIASGLAGLITPATLEVGTAQLSPQMSSPPQPPPATSSHEVLWDLYRQKVCASIPVSRLASACLLCAC